MVSPAVPAAAAAPKRCQKCSRDVTHDKRMKDSKGGYWCMDCGTQDESKRPGGLVQPCPKCKQPTHATAFVRHKEKYVCEACAGIGNRKPDGTPVAVAADSGKKVKLALAAVLLVAGGLLIANNFLA